jgi:hypothetical protein
MKNHVEEWIKPKFKLALAIVALTVAVAFAPSLRAAPGCGSCDTEPGGWFSIGDCQGHNACYGCISGTCCNTVLVCQDGTVDAPGPVCTCEPEAQ